MIKFCFHCLKFIDEIQNRRRWNVHDLITKKQSYRWIKCSRKLYCHSVQNTNLSYTLKRVHIWISSEHSFIPYYFNLQKARRNSCYSLFKACRHISLSNSSWYSTAQQHRQHLFEFPIINLFIVGTRMSIQRTHNSDLLDAVCVLNLHSLNIHPKFVGFGDCHWQKIHTFYCVLIHKPNWMWFPRVKKKKKERELN